MKTSIEKAVLELVGKNPFAGTLAIHMPKVIVHGTGVGSDIEGKILIIGSQTPPEDLPAGIETTVLDSVTQLHTLQ